MKTLADKMNIKFGASSQESAIEIDARRDINTYDTFCLYCADNNIDLKEIDDSDFESCVDLINNFINQANDDTGYKISFWLDI